MPLRFSCSTCSQTLQALEDQAGCSVRCPKCTNIMVVPGAATSERPPAIVEEPRQKSCPMCGESIDAYAKRCRFCGEMVDRSMGSDSEPTIHNDKAYRRYKESMRGMSSGLFFFGVLLILCGVGVAGFAGAPVGQVEGLVAVVTGMFVMFMGICNFTMGIFARRLHNWVNYVVIVLYSLWILIYGSLFVLALQQEKNVGGGGCSLIIAIAFIYTAAQNLKHYSKATSSK